MKTNMVGRSLARLAVLATLGIISASFPVTVSAGELKLRLERAVSTGGWEAMPLNCEMLTEDGIIIVPAGESAGLFQLQIGTLEIVPVPAGMILVQGGTLAMSMGTVAVDTFYLGQYEVTWAEWQAVRAQAASLGYDIGGVGAGCADDNPVHSVNWYDVVKWCNLKSELEGLTPVYSVEGAIYRNGEFDWDGSHVVQQNLSANGYRLPFEAEWEFAARGGTRTKGFTYAGSNDLNAVGWYGDNSEYPDDEFAECSIWWGRGTWPVGSKAPNELGLYDMSGNVAEWCGDPDRVGNRRLRGGSWLEAAGSCEVSLRFEALPTIAHFNRGLRLARNFGD